MTFTKVDYPVERGKTNERTSRKNVDAIFDEFMSMNTKAVKINFSMDEYKNSRSAFQSFYKAAVYLKYPIEVLHRMGEVYLVRTDM